MSTCYGDPVLDFDLNFLRPTPSSTVVNSRTDKQRKAILIVKKKTIATDSLIKKYYAKRESLDQSEKNLLNATEECKQICIDYKKSVEECSNLEKDLLQLKSTNKELEAKYFNLENQFQAANSHANQLQTLVKEHETLIEALKIEKKLNSKPTDKDYKKMLQPLQKENNMLIKHICLARDIIFGKIKYRLCHKEVLKNYDKYKSPDKDDPLFGKEDVNDDYISDEIPLSPFSDEFDDDAESFKGNKSPTPNVNVNNSNIVDQSRISTMTAECNEVASIDTGRGSSMAFSVSDKSFHSPDYFIDDSPLSDDSELNKVKSKLVDSATSPVPFCETVTVSTSPVIFETNSLENNPIMTDQALSPIVLPAETDDILTINADDDNSLRTDIDSLLENNEEDKASIENEDNRKEKECLELNNSDNTSNESSHDCEIEMILSTMRLHNKLITPIPATPVKLYTKCRNNSVCMPKIQEHSPNVVCPEAVLAREENKKLQASISELAKELFNIKNMLLNRSIAMPNNKESEENNELCAEDSINQNHDTSSIQPPSKDVKSHKIENTTSCVTEKSNMNINRKSQDDNMLEFSTSEKLYTIPEVEVNYRDTSTLHCKEVTTNISHKGIECNDVSETNVKNTEPTGNISIDSRPPIKDNHYKIKLLKRKKITKLGKLKQKLLPKYKIRRENLPLKRKNIKIKQPINPNKKKLVTAADSSATLNNKNVYEKAVKVMTELKRKKSVCIENNFTTQNEKDLSENNHLDAVECSENEKHKDSSLFSEESNTIKTSPIGTRNRSKVCALTNINTDLKLDISPKKSVQTKIFDDKHEKNSNEDLTKSSEIKKCIKRVPESLPSGIPCKRVLRSSTLDKDPKVVLYRCEDLMDDPKYNSVIKNTLNSVSPKRKSPQNNLAGIFSPEVNPKTPESKDGRGNDLISNLRKSVRVLSFPEVSPKVLEHKEINDNEDLPSHRRRSVKDIPTPQVSPKAPGQERNGNHNSEINTCSLEIRNNKAQEHQELSCSQYVTDNPRESILCRMIEQYGVKFVKFHAKKVSDNITNSTAQKIEDDIARIVELSANEAKEAMNNFILDIQHWDVTHFLAGLLKYLKDPTRKIELFNKVAAISAPALTKSEQILLYVISELKSCWSPVDIVDKILCCIEYTLFSLNRTPHIEVIESMSHFYAVICRYFKMKTRLRLFVLDAMYCIQFKAVPLIRQCIEVWSHILPLAHMASAQTPLVICLVYLLHFYKCDDKFNRVQDIRNILSRKYFYQITEWNETKILELFRNSIKALRGSQEETKMLRIALIILAKRHGPRWCQNNIVKNLLQPMIENQNSSVHVKAFCVSMLGPLLKPFPADMKVHCEIVMNQLITMLQENPPPEIAEAVVSSLIYINKHNQFRVIQALVVWKPVKISTDLEVMLKEFIKSKPLKSWKSTLSRAVQ